MCHMYTHRFVARAQCMEVLGKVRKWVGPNRGAPVYWGQGFAFLESCRVSP